MAKATGPLTSGIAPNPYHREKYPWHNEIWSLVTQDLKRLPHALLLCGPEGLGKQAFAWRLAHTLLCASATNEHEACYDCRSCGFFAAGTHPDLTRVAPLEDSVIIGVDQIRALRDFFILKPHTAPRKIAILAPAESMNVNAANSLLKLLEEPPLGSLLVLVTANTARLPATIRSRCAKVQFRSPNRTQAVAWLNQQLPIKDRVDLLLDMTGGAPLGALRLGDDFLELHEQLLRDTETLREHKENPIRCATRWRSYGSERCLNWFQIYVTKEIHKNIENSKYINIKYLLHIFHLISNYKKQLKTPIDETLMLENILINWARISGNNSVITC